MELRNTAFGLDQRFGQSLTATSFTDEFDEEKFLAGGRRMLDGVQAFWTGLNEHRIAAAYQTG